MKKCNRHVAYFNGCETCEIEELTAEVEKAHLRADASDSDYLDTKSLLEKAEATNQRLRDACETQANEIVSLKMNAEVLECEIKDQKKAFLEFEDPRVQRLRDALEAIISRAATLTGARSLATKALEGEE